MVITDYDQIDCLSGGSKIVTIYASSAAEAAVVNEDGGPGSVCPECYAKTPAE
jgi:hypothetical protein